MKAGMVTDFIRERLSIVKSVHEILKYFIRNMVKQGTLLTLTRVIILVMKYILSFLVCCITLTTQAQIKSPEEFLGYPLGQRYTPHHRVVAYFEYLAKAHPQQILLETYGYTNEGRPLILATVSSAQNIQQIEQIRQQNLGLTKGKNSSGKPVSIVWMSYNVHGNETSSTEAALKTIYELINPATFDSKKYLENTVVLLDPCINPDGRDRYVNWFNTTVGTKANPVPFTREHTEPWPGGRPNHYYHDLNRDWAWQTQVESQQRAVVYNKWLPHIHIDFHEQGYNNPYYFAPAAEPFHEVITDWQRELQVMIGKNNAKYFDQNGWLFFTKESFDLLYPSYGDTYPIYKGAIGLTYEQAGHSRAGSTVITGNGDTLTLLDRLTHHFTTGMATVETASKNADRIVKEFKAYYDKANKGIGDYAAYLVKADKGGKIERLKQLLTRNDIEWHNANSNSYSGLNYFTNQTQSVKAVPEDIFVYADQPNGHLVKVLFERETYLSDSITYDITAWSLPYVYGLETYGLKTSPNYKKGALMKIQVMPAIPENATAYVIPWNGPYSAKYLSRLLQQNVKVRYAQFPFQVDGKSFDRGSLIVAKTSNQHIGKNITSVLMDANAGLNLIIEGISTTFMEKGYDMGSSSVGFIKAPRITMLAGEGTSSLNVGELWHFFDYELEYPVNMVNANDLSASILDQTDVLIIPEGYYRTFQSGEIRNTIKTWVSRGGKVIAIEAAVNSLMGADWWGLKEKTWKVKPVDSVDKNKLIKYEDRNRAGMEYDNPGSIFKVKLDNTHPLAYGYPEQYFTIKGGSTVYEYFDGVGNVGIFEKNSHVAGFAGPEVKKKLSEGMLIGVQNVGRGAVVYFGDNPVFRSFWENGKLMLSNAVFIVAQ
jgi:hypothetical protein